MHPRHRPVVLEEPPQLGLGGVVVEPGHEQRAEGVLGEGRGIHRRLVPHAVHRPPERHLPPVRQRCLVDDPRLWVLPPLLPLQLLLDVRLHALPELLAVLLLEGFSAPLLLAPSLLLLALDGHLQVLRRAEGLQRVHLLVRVEQVAHGLLVLLPSLDVLV